MPKVSVIIPTHNRAEFLRAAIRSVLGQTFQDFEIIVIDDASRDQTSEIVHSFADERIKYIYNQVNKGEGGSRNIGLMHASGDLIALLDDDDEWLPEKLELQVSLLENSPSKTGVVYTGHHRIDRTTGKQRDQLNPTKRGDILADLCAENWLVPSSLLLRKECFRKAGWFEEGVSFGADYDVWLRIAKDFDFDYIKQPLVKYYVHGSNITANHEVVIKGLENQLEKYASLWASTNKGRSQRYLSLGVLYCYTGNMQKGRAALLKAIRLYPLSLRYYVNLFFSLLGVVSFRRLTDAKEALIFRMRETRFSLASKR